MEEQLEFNFDTPSFTIEKVTVTAKSHKLKGSWTIVNTIFPYTSSIKKKFAWRPRRCSITSKFFWMTHCYKVSTYIELGMMEHAWHSPQGHTLWVLRNSSD